MVDKVIPDAMKARLRQVMGRVQRWTKDRDISQRALAEHLDMSESQISKWVAGKMPPGLDKLIRIADAVGVPLERLLASEPGAAAGAEHLSDLANSAEKIAILDMWDSIPPDIRGGVLQTLRGIAAAQPAGAKVG